MIRAQRDPDLYNAGWKRQPKPRPVTPPARTFDEWLGAAEAALDRMIQEDNSGLLPRVQGGGK